MNDKPNRKNFDTKKNQKKFSDEELMFKNKATKQYKQRKRDLEEEDIMKEIERYR